jgi:DNA-binding transcriptional ArsR family regulator
MFKALGVPTRVRILKLLKSEGPLGVKTIAEAVGVTPAAVSQHLKVLRHAGLVTSERRGYWVPYSIDEEALENCRCMLNEVCTCRCHDTEGSEKEPGSTGARLERLNRYKRQLTEELEAVRRRIAEIKQGDGER